MYRTHRCNEIREQHIGNVIELAGWVDVVRDHGGVIFVDLRDKTGIVQLAFDENTEKSIFIAENLRHLASNPPETLAQALELILIFYHILYFCP